MNLNTARAPNIKANSPEVKEVVDFGERVRYMLDVKINQLRMVMRRTKTPIKSDMLMIRIQALEWVQGRIQDIILNNVTTDWPVYDE